MLPRRSRPPHAARGGTTSAAARQPDGCSTRRTIFRPTRCQLPGERSDRQDVERPSRSRAAVALVVARDAHAVAALGRAPRPSRAILEVIVDAAGRLTAPQPPRAAAA